MKADIEKLFADETFGLLKTLLKYKDFDSIKILVTVKDGKISSLDGAFNYVKEGDEQDTVEPLIKLHLIATEQTFDYAPHLEQAEQLYDLYKGVLELKARIDELLKNIYASRGYLDNLEKATTEYSALSDQEKDFVGADIGRDLDNAKTRVTNVLSFLDVYRKYDLNHLTNQSIYELAKAYSSHPIDGKLLSTEIGSDEYNKLSDLGNFVDYSSFDSAISKMIGEDETSWGLSEQEIRDIKLIFDISHYESSVTNQLLLKLLLNGNTLTTDVIESKINNLYLALA